MSVKKRWESNLTWTELQSYFSPNRITPNGAIFVWPKPNLTERKDLPNQTKSELFTVGSIPMDTHGKLYVYRNKNPSSSLKSNWNRYSWLHAVSGLVNITKIQVTICAELGITEIDKIRTRREQTWTLGSIPISISALGLNTESFKFSSVGTSLLFVGNCSPGWSCYLSRCYYRSTVYVDQPTARARCQSLNADVASVSNRDENNFVYTIWWVN